MTLSLALLTIFAAVPSVTSAVAKPPTVAPCDPKYTEEPLMDPFDLPHNCTGSRLMHHAAPSMPQKIEVDKTMTITWPAACGPDDGLREGCVQAWIVNLTLFERRPDGGTKQLVWGPDAYGLTVVGPCHGVPNCQEPETCGNMYAKSTCAMELRSDGTPIPNDIVVVLGVVARYLNPCAQDFETGKCQVPPEGLPWLTTSSPLLGPSSARQLELTLRALGPGNEYSLDRMITVAQTQTVELILTNESEETLQNLTFTGGQPLVVDPRGTGGLEIVSGPSPAIGPSLTLAPGEEKTFTFEVEATQNGVAAAHSQVLAVGTDGVERKAAHSLKFDIEDGIEMTRNVGQWLRMQAMDQLLQETFGQAYESMARRGQNLAARLSEVFTPERRKQWFGSETGLPLTPTDFSIALLRGAAPEMVAALLPKEDLDGHTVEELDAAYNASFKRELSKGVSKYVQGWSDLAAGTKKFLGDSWAESMLTANYVVGSATPEERAQFEAFSMTLIDGSYADTANYVTALKKEIPKWRENGTYLVDALYETQAGGGVRGAMKTAAMFKEAIDAESSARDELVKLAETDPMAFQRQWAKRDAQILNKGLVPIFDTLLGGGVVKGAGALKGIVIRGNGSGIIRAGEAAGVLDEGANVVKGAGSALQASDSAVPQGLPNGTAAELGRAGNYLDNVEGATIVQSSDLGNVYELPNLGGVPEVTLDAKAGILKSLEQEYLEKTGQQIQLAEVLKPSSPLRKPGGVAKVELTAAKTGKPAMLDAGAPRDVLAEANVWTGPDPRTLPGFGDLPKLRQQAALEEWSKAKKSWEAYHNPAAGSKEARLKQVMGHEERVPLDVKPNDAGLQRFVTAHFEEVAVTQGDAEAKLIRVKKYEIEVVDTTRNNQVVNRKTVVDLPEAAPQTPDADGVAMAKVIGRDPAGKPILAPLNRAEREFVMQRYIDKNVKARRLPPGTAGAINDLAEHGVTLVMDDASAVAAGKLLPMFGVPFLPEGVGTAYLKRIAPFVAAKNATPAQVDAMYRQMVELARSEGGFAQHAVVVTSDSRYLGEIPFASW